jgi:hypothetical protein
MIRWRRLSIALYDHSWMQYKRDDRASLEAERSEEEERKHDSCHVCSREKTKCQRTKYD